MQEHNLFFLFIKPLNQLNIPYMVTGAAAAIIYGTPRTTLDIDIVIRLLETNVHPLIKEFPKDSFYCLN